MMEAFEKQNRLTFVVTLSLVETAGQPDVQLEGKVWEQKSDRRVVKPLASQSVTCRRERVRTLEGALTYLLYQLDFALAEHEFEGTQFSTAEAGTTD